VLRNVLWPVGMTDQIPPILRKRAQMRIATRGDTFATRTGFLWSGSLRALAISTAALVTCVGLSAGTACAQDASWVGLGADQEWNTSSNWSTNSVPTGVATFTGTHPLSVGITFSGVSIDTIKFAAGAPTYTLSAIGSSIDFNGAGIVNNSPNAPSFDFLGTRAHFNNASSAGDAVIAGGTIIFRNASTAGTATISHASFLYFEGNATAGTATITNNNPFELNFLNSATAGNATITNQGLAFFKDGSSAGSATIGNAGTLSFNSTSTAGGATVTNSSALGFNDASTAGNAQITNAGTLSFNNGSTAGNAAIGNTGMLNFNNTSTAGNANISNNGTFNSTGNITFNDSGTAGSAIINNSAILSFKDGSTAGHAAITNALAMDFSGTSSAGNAAITNNSSLQFNSASTAGNSVITNNHPGFVFFRNASTAGSASISNVGFLNFGDTSTAGNATIANNLTASFAGEINFNNSSTAGNANITNNNNLIFNDSSTAGSAIITSNGRVNFSGTSTGASARFVNEAGGIVDFSGSAGANNDGLVTGGSIEGAGTYFLGARKVSVGSNNLSTTVSGVIGDCTSGIVPQCSAAGIHGTGGALVKAGSGTLTLTGTNTYTGGTTITAGILQLGGGGATGSIAGDVTDNATLAFNRSNTYQFDGAITGSGALRQNGTGTTTLTAANTYSGGTTISAGVLQLGNGGANGSIVGNVLDNATFAINRLDSFTFGGVISGTGAFQQLGSGTTILTNANTYAGGTTIAGGTLRVENNAALGTGAVTTTGSVLDYASGISLANQIEINSNHTRLQVLGGNATQAGIISELNGPRPLEKIGGGRLVLTALNTYSGPTTVTGGALDVVGSIASSSLITVNTGATLTGTGMVGNTMIANGGTFAPGNGTPGSSITVSGNLAFQSGAVYLVQVSPAVAAFTNVSGRATLDGTVFATYGGGSNYGKHSTIVSAAGGISGTFAGLANTNVPSNFTPSLSYDATHAYLDLTLSFTPAGGGSNTGLTGNQQSVGNGLIGYFNTSGSIPVAFGALASAGLTQISGEAATGTQQVSFNAMDQFMGLLTDPFVTGRGNSGVSSATASQFAEERDAASYSTTGSRGSERDAYAAVYGKVPPRVVDPFVGRWSVWAAGFGGAQTTDGNASLGSNTASSRVYGTAVGADYRLSPNTLAGFALAGGGTSFGIANNLGRGSSDLFQAGAFLRHRAGAAYISAALAYGWQDITTDRTVTVAGVDQLRARFKANAFSGRTEGGYRYVTPWMGVTPYAAGQFTTFDLPSYAETVVSGAGTFALGYASKSITASRSELGVRSDKSYAVGDAILTLRGRAAWAHAFNPDRSIAATFQALPGASFIVNGAASARDAALTTASAEWSWLNGFSFAGTFEGEFSSVTRSYAGKGVARYQW
jgi:autotransporter-associated beta strand protein